MGTTDGGSVRALARPPTGDKKQVSAGLHLQVMNGGLSHSLKTKIRMPEMERQAEKG